MLAFEVYANGKKKCIAGIGEPGVLTTTLTSVRSEADGRRRRHTKAAAARESGTAATPPEGIRETDGEAVRMEDSEVCSIA